MKAISFIIHSNILIALAALALTLASQVQLGMNPHFHPYLAAIFLATLFDYNLHRYLAARKKPETDTIEKFRWTDENPVIFRTLIILSFAGLVVVLFFVRIEILLLLIPLAFFSFLYSFPFPGREKHHFRVQKITGMKTMLIAGVWSGVTVLVPVFFGEQSFHFQQVALLFAERFTFIFAIALPFDIRDIKSDSISYLKTIPIVFGENMTLKTTNVFMLISLSIASFHYSYSYMLFILPAYIFSIVISVFFINSKTLKSLPLYYYGILDGSIFLHGVMIFGSYYLVN